jgi:hypothetical protein
MSRSAPGSWVSRPALTPSCPSKSHRAQAYDVVVSDAAHPTDEAPHGTALLPSDLTDDQLADAPVLASIDALVIEDLSEDEDDAFAAALGS